ncbi:MAG: glycosyltransferase family 2 protein [Patescibacteria group bacterium]|nr:glycosyltransferase family 2 protein [Patescibacteria group bacterium]
MISVIVPIFNEEKTVTELYKRIFDVMSSQQESYEIIFVNDGSKDKTREIASRFKSLRLISLQRNYGQTAAIDTGIYSSRGDKIALLDADLQNDPAEIITLLKKMEEGFDVVIGRRVGRKDATSRMIFSFFANFFARLILGVKIHDFGCGLKVYRSKFIKDFRLRGESQVFLVAVAKERGARITEVPVTFHYRQAGTSKIRISKMIKGVFDFLSMVFFVKYFSKPLRFFGGWGLVCIILSLIFFGFSVGLRLMHILNITETPLPIVGTLFAILGVLLFMIGLLAEMMLLIYYDNPNRSPYMIGNIIENE